MINILESKEEWLKCRDKIGGSDAASIIGLNPYRTNIELWKIKTGQMNYEDISDKACVKYGVDAELHLRELFKLDFPQFDVEYIENNMFTNDKYPFAHASLDGWLTDKDGRKGVLEIKTTNILQSMQKEKWKNQIPDNYYIQILHYLMVTEYDFAILVAQLKSEFHDEVYKQTKHYIIERTNVEDDINYLINAEEIFWQHVKEKKKPDLVLPKI